MYSNFFMYFIAIIWVLFISLHNICLHCNTKINKLLHKLCCMICFITKSSNQLIPRLFRFFLLYQVVGCLCYCHRFCVLSYFCLASFIYRSCSSRIYFGSSPASVKLPSLYTVCFVKLLFDLFIVVALLQYSDAQSM